MPPSPPRRYSTSTRIRLLSPWPPDNGVTRRRRSAQVGSRRARSGRNTNPTPPPASAANFQRLRTVAATRCSMWANVTETPGHRRHCSMTQQVSDNVEGCSSNVRPGSIPQPVNAGIWISRSGSTIAQAPRPSRHRASIVSVAVIAPAPGCATSHSTITPGRRSSPGSGSKPREHGLSFWPSSCLNEKSPRRSRSSSTVSGISRTNGLGGTGMGRSTVRLNTTQGHTTCPYSIVNRARQEDDPGGGNPPGWVR